MKAFAIIAVFFISNLTFSTRAEILEISSSDLKAYWVMPVSSRIDVNASWIEVIANNAQVMRTPMSQLNFKGILSPQFDNDGLLRLKFAETDKSTDQAVIAVQERVQGWYPPVEICQNSAERTNCRIVFELNTERNTLTAKILFVK